MAKILVTARSFAASAIAKEVLEKENYEITFNPYGRTLTEQELVELIPGTAGLIAGLDEVTEKVIAAGQPTLKIIARYGVGYNNVDLNAARKYGVAVTITPGANNISVAELAMGLMLATARNIARIDALVRQGSWQRVKGVELNQKVLGVIGLGSIGSEVAKRASAFNMQILAYDKYVRQDMIEKYGVRYVTLDELLVQSDFISLHAPALPETVGMINKEKLRMMKSTAVLINTARGDLIVEEDLCTALTEHWIAAAALDAFVHEPLENSPLCKLENVVLTSHIGANTAESADRMGSMAAKEVVRVLSGGVPQNSVR